MAVKTGEGEARWARQFSDTEKLGTAEGDTRMWGANRTVHAAFQ